MPYFDVIWEIFEKRHTEKEEKGRLVRPVEGPLADLGFASPTGKIFISNGIKIVLDEVLPNILFHKSQSKKEWTDRVKDLTLKVCNEYNVHPAVPIALTKHLPDLLVDAYLGIQNNPTFEILIVIGSKFKKLSGGKTLVNKIKNRSSRYDIYIDRDGEDIKVFNKTYKEISDFVFKLLLLLLTNMGRICSYEQILYKVWWGEQIKPHHKRKKVADKPDKDSDDTEWVKQRDRIMKAISGVERLSETLLEGIERVKNHGVKLHSRKWKYSVIEFKNRLPDLQ